MVDGPIVDHRCHHRRSDYRLKISSHEMAKWINAGQVSSVSYFPRSVYTRAGILSGGITTPMYTTWLGGVGDLQRLVGDL